MKFLYSCIIVLLAILAVAVSQQLQQAEFCKLNFKECAQLNLKSGSSLGQVTNLSFNGTCTSEGAAILKKGTVVEIDFQFQSYNPQSTLKSVVHGQISGSPWLPFPFDKPDACKDSGLTCPIPANTTLDYKPTLNVLSQYPSLQVVVKWQLQDARKADIFCVVLPANIID